MAGACARQRMLPSPALCGANCDEEESDSGRADPEGRLMEGHDRPPPFPVSVDQPQPEVVPGGDGKLADEIAQDDSPYPPPERTEFVVHVEQKPGSPAPSPSVQAHHHQHHPEYSGVGRGGGSGSRRRHHRMPCWDHEKRERQCLNGGQCFAIRLYNGIRRSGCRFVTCSRRSVKRVTLTFDLAFRSAFR